MRNIKVLVLWIVILLTFARAEIKNAPKNIFHKYRDSICLVTFYQNLASETRIGSTNKMENYRIGIIVSQDGLVLVSSDVYPVSMDIVSGNGSFLSRKPTGFRIKLSDGSDFPAEFIGKDDQAQVAFLEIKELSAGRRLRPVEFQTEKSLSVADTVFVLELLSESYNFQPLFTPFTINAVVETPRKKYLVNNYSPALSSAGLVLDAEGEAVGITLKQSMELSFHSSINFEEMQKSYLEIAPAGWFAALIKNPPRLKTSSAVQRAWLGIRMQALNRDLQKYWHVPQNGGIIINQIYQDSPAERAGLKTGDVILQVNDSTLLVQKDEETGRLRNLVREYPPGKTLSVKIFRKRKILEKEVIPTAAPGAIGMARSFAVVSLGLEIRELTRDILYENNLSLNLPGVFVYQVDRASPAGLAGLQVGDIIQEIDEKPVQTFEKAVQIISGLSKSSSKIIRLKVLNNQETRFVFIDQTEEK